MTMLDKENLVAQLLEERRQRLREKLRRLDQEENEEESPAAWRRPLAVQRQLSACSTLSPQACDISDLASSANARDADLSGFSWGSGATPERPADMVAAAAATCLLPAALAALGAVAAPAVPPPSATWRSQVELVRQERLAVHRSWGRLEDEAHDFSFGHEALLGSPRRPHREAWAAGGAARLAAAESGGRAEPPPPPARGAAARAPAAAAEGAAPACPALVLNACSPGPCRRPASAGDVRGPPQRGAPPRRPAALLSGGGHGSANEVPAEAAATAEQLAAVPEASTSAASSETCGAEVLAGAEWAARADSDIRSLRHLKSKAKQDQARREKEQREMQECTFRPTISTRSQYYANKARGCSTEPLVERLHHEADKRVLLREKAKELLERDESMTIPFRPAASGKARPNQGDWRSPPLHLRAQSWQRRRSERLRVAQEAEGKRQEGLFQPQILESSRRIVETKRRNLQRSFSEGSLRAAGPVEERLYGEAQLREQRRLASQQNAAELAQPNVDERSRRICESSVYFQGAQQDFLTRQQTFEVAKQRRREVRVRHAEDGCSFAPALDPRSRQLVATNVDFIRSTPEEVTERLGVKDIGRRHQRRERRVEAQGEGCTFRPTVNAVSARLAASRSPRGRSADAVHERLYAASLVGKENLSCHSESQECTFKPQVSEGTLKMYPHIRSRYSGDGDDVAANVQEELSRREQQLVERRKQHEEQQLAACTFAPAVPPRSAPRREPVIVSGLSRFFELKTLASRQQEGKQRREAEVFNRSVENARCNGMTILAPFNLSSDQPARASAQDRSS